MILWNKALGEKFSYLAKKIYERWLHLRYQYLALESDTILLLRRLRKEYLLGLITNGPSNAQWEKVRKLSLEQYFDVILVSGDLPWEKPEARIFEEACQFLNVTPSNCVMIGDKLETDILGMFSMHNKKTKYLHVRSQLIHVCTNKTHLIYKSNNNMF